MIARSIVKQFEHSGEALPDVVPDVPVTIAELLATIARLTARVAELELPPEPWTALKPAAYDCGVEYETARTWAVKGLIEAQRDGKRWVCHVSSLRARKQRLAAPCAK
jgi:hypothetical protein